MRYNGHNVIDYVTTRNFDNMEEFRKACGFTEDEIYDIVSGKMKPTINMLFKMAKALETYDINPILYLFYPEQFSSLVEYLNNK